MERILFCKDTYFFSFRKMKILPLATHLPFASQERKKRVKRGEKGERNSMLTISLLWMGVFGRFF